MKKSFDDILNECIRQLETAGGDIEVVLSRYPEHAEDLRPHLQVWQSLSAVEQVEATPQGVMRVRQQFLTAMAKAQRKRQDVSLINSLATKGGLSMRFLAMFVAGAAVALAITLLTGNLEFGGGSSTEAQELPACLLTLDFNGDGRLTVEDVVMFRDAIENQDPAFDHNGDGVVDIHDVVSVIREVIVCFQQQQPTPPPLP